MRVSSGMFIASIPSSVCLPGILFTGGNAAHGWFILSVFLLALFLHSSGSLVVLM